MKNLEEINGLNILPYSFDKDKNCFVCRSLGGSDTAVFKIMIKIITILEEEKVTYAMVGKDIQILDKEALDITNSMVVKLDKDGNIIYINAYACNITGYKADEVYGKNWFKYFIPVKEEDETHQVFKDLLSNKTQTWKHTNSILCKDNTLKVIDWDNILEKEEGSEEIVFAIGTIAS